MSYRGHVENGVVVLDDPGFLPEGTVVEVDPVESTDGESTEKEVPSLYESLKPVIGMAKGLPPDLAENHDHYIHGRPKK
jgi:hypothetical protein